MGYYATITASSNGQYVGATTPCLLVPSMATGYWQSQGRIGSITINSWNSSASQYTFHAQQYWTSGAPFVQHTVSYSACTSNPVSYPVPTFTGGVNDPAILPEGIATNSSGSSATALHIENPTVTLEIPQQSEQQKIESFFDGLTLGWAVATVMVVVYLIRRVHR